MTVLKLADRVLVPLADTPECAAMPFPVDHVVLGRLRPDQVPRMLGAITHPDLNPAETFAFADVVAVQNRVSIEKVTALAAKPAADTGAIVATIEGKKYILDGHHRIVAAYIRGDADFVAHHIDLTDVSNAMKSAPRATTATVCKVDTTHGLVFGYAIVCKEDGVEYFDLQDDHIPEDVMLKASHEFMAGDRVGADMHVWTRDGVELRPGDDFTGAEPVRKGSVVFAFPMTTDIAKSLDITIKRSGLLVAYKPDSEDILQKFASGEYTGFSIGGSSTKVKHSG